MMGTNSLNELYPFTEAFAFKPSEGSSPPLWRYELTSSDEFILCAGAVRTAHGRLCALWGTDRRLSGKGFGLDVLYGISIGFLHLQLSVPDSAEPLIQKNQNSSDTIFRPTFPDISGIFPTADRMQRMTQDLLGYIFQGGDQRPWLQHSPWAVYPLRRDANVPNTPLSNSLLSETAPSHDETQPQNTSQYEFVQVGGEGAHEIPVGPIHAGIIEPGHFRFSVVGERVLRLEERMGYTHKGTEKLFLGKSPQEAAALAGRISGDSTCAYSWAFAAAVEAASATKISQRALILRAMLLERERIANHLGDLGALGNDTALSFGFAQFMRLKEDWLRFHEGWCGHRYLMDRIVPGGVHDIDVSADLLHALGEQCDVIEQEVLALSKIYENHAGFQDRVLKTGLVSPMLAHEYSVTGFAARACGLALDLRVATTNYQPPVPYTALNVRVALDDRGDVAARVGIRFAEIFESLRLLRVLSEQITEGALCVPLQPLASKTGLSIIEGWRGEIIFALEFDEEEKISRAHPHDPSWQIWPLIEVIMLNDIVPDFPLINKSFNLSYSGVDL